MTVETLLLNDQFLHWVLDPNEELDIYWNNWMATHPTEIPTLLKARDIVVSLNQQSPNIDQQKKIETIKAKVWEKISSNFSENVIPFNEKNKSLRWVAVAASVFVIIISLTFVVLLNNKKFSSSQPKPFEFASNLLTTKKTNSNSQPIKIYMVDGTEIVLSPNSSIEYESLYTSNQRNVKLQGNAFFMVEKNESKPFVIYTPNASVQVLGTSFNMIQDENSHRLLVAVKSGEVKVSSSYNNQFIHLNKGQQVQVDPTEAKLVSELVSDSTLLHIPSSLEESFNYDQTNVLEIFNDLQKIYGVKIETKPNELKNCLITTDLSTGSLFDKLDVLAALLNTSYKVNDGVIRFDKATCQ